MIGDLHQKTKEHLLEDLCSHGFDRDTVELAQYAAAIAVKSVQDLEHSIDDFTATVREATPTQ